MSSSPDNGDLVLPTPVELSRILTFVDNSAMFDSTFHSTPNVMARLREYHFLSIGISNLLRDLERHRTERAALHRILMNTEGFQEGISPIYLEIRRRQQEANFSVNDDFALPSPVAVPSSPITSPRSSSSSSEPRIVEIVEEPSVAIDSRDSSIESHSSFHTAPNNEAPMWNPSTWGIPMDAELGTRERPINVDQIPDKPPSALTLPYIVRRTRSTPSPFPTTKCHICNKNSHQPDGCIQMGPIICPICDEVNAHVRENCPEYRRDLRRWHPRMQFCLICSQPGHQLEWCPTLLPFSQ